jgi:hypothetical protein
LAVILAVSVRMTAVSRRRTALGLLFAASRGQEIVMARTPNYSFERQERERLKAKKAEQKAAEKAAAKQAAEDAAPKPPTDDQ